MGAKITIEVETDAGFVEEEVLRDCGEAVAEVIEGWGYRSKVTVVSE